MNQPISFKPLTEADFSLLYKWLNIDFVTKWYEKRKFTYDDVEKKYGPRVRHEIPTYSFIMYYDDKPIGYIQTYRIHDYPKYAACVEVDEHTAGIDLFLGEKDYIHRGLGKSILRLFLKRVVFADDTIQSCIVGPEEDNTSAIRMYEKAGFRYLKTVQCEGEQEPEYLMSIGRKKLEETVIFEQ